MCDTADMHGFGQFAQVALSQKLVAEIGGRIRDVQPVVRQPATATAPPLPSPQVRNPLSANRRARTVAVSCVGPRTDVRDWPPRQRPARWAGSRNERLSY